jgi:acyl-coenzyme A synthetase/AMP-(fatty) acid ligase
MVGDIEVTPTLVDAYAWDEEASALAFHDGWYRTRDIGVMPEPGKLMVLGRSDEMVTIGGVKTAPQAMEARLRSLPGIREAVLLGVPRAGGIEELTVVLECDMDRLPSPLAQAMVGILAGVVERLHPVLLPSLPRTETGKVRRPALRAALAAAAAARQR